MKRAQALIEPKRDTMAFEIYIANTRGMCAGVDRAIRTVNCALEKYGDKVYVLHEVVHNKHVVQSLEKKGATFVECIDDVPDGSVLIFSAHGVGLEIMAKAKNRNFINVIDATCPLVKRVHFKINKASQEHKKAIVIGHAGHQEVIGTVGQYDGDKSNVHVVMSVDDVNALNLDGKNLVFATQTTLSIDEAAKTVQALKAKFPEIEGPVKDDTCYATQHRQEAIKQLAQMCDVVLVAGSKNSSNSNRLREVAQSVGAVAYLIDDYTDIDNSWFDNAKKVGVSAGASAPEYLVQDIIKHLQTLCDVQVQGVGLIPADRVFPLPDNI